MSSLISDAEKAAMEALLSDVADTFARPLTIIRQANEVVIYNNPDNSFIYQNTPFNTETIVTPVTGVFNGRIWYERRQPLDLLSSLGGIRGTDQLDVRVQEGYARLKLPPSGAAFMNGAERVQFDGNSFTIDSTPRPHGLFTPQYYTYWLKRTN